MERFLTLPEVCRLLGSEDPKGRMVRRLRDRGELEAVKFGRRLMFKQSSVEKYIERQFKLQNPKRKGSHNSFQGDEHSTYVHY